MNDLNSLDHLGSITDEMLGGLHADDAMRLSIKRAAAQGKPVKAKKTAARLAPALCCAALAVVCVGAATGRLGGMQKPAEEPVIVSRMAPVEISTIAAGEGAGEAGGVLVADLGDGARVRSGSSDQALFASADGDIAMVAVDGYVYRMLETPKDIGDSLLGGEVGSVKLFTKEPSLASSGDLQDGLSNVAKEGGSIYKVGGLKKTSAVAAEVDGSMRLFQRVSYAGKGPGGASLEDTFSVRGKVKAMELSGVGTLEGEAANRVMDVLLDQATLKSADASARRQTLTVTLENGLRLQLGVSGDTLCGCGGWSCPEFFEAFEAAL